MNRWIKVGLVVAFFILGGCALSWLALPQIVDALPGSIRGRLPGPIIALVTTPLPTALPAPEVSGQSTPFEIVVPTLGVTQTINQSTNQPETSQQPPAAGTAESLEPTPTLIASPTPSPEPTATKIPPPPSARINGLAIIPQRFNNCGPANLSQTMTYYGETHEQMAIAATLRPNPDDRNVSPDELAAYVNEQTNLRAAVYTGGDLILLKHLIAAGFPVIVEKGLIEDEEEGWIGHYLTVFGYDDGRQEFDTLDTLLGPWDSSGLPVSYPEMGNYWSHFNNTFVIVYQPEQEAQLHNILGPVMIEPLQMWQQAAVNAQQQLENEPENPFIWFNLGTNLTELAEVTGDTNYYQSAAAAYDRAREIGLPFRMLWYQFQPYEAYLAVGRFDDVTTLTNAVLSTSGGDDVEETYLYQGLMRLAMGNIEGAVASYQEAVRLNSGYDAAVQALREVE
jgi:hypothetical protein